MFGILAFITETGPSAISPSLTNELRFQEDGMLRDTPTRGEVLVNNTLVHRISLVRLQTHTVNCYQKAVSGRTLIVHD